MIPDYQTLMRPVLQVSSHGEVHISDVYEQLAAEFQLTQEDLDTLLPSGKQGLFANRVRWARTYLKEAGLLQSTRRGYITITDEGKKALESGAKINNRYLKQFPAFLDFMSRSGTQSTVSPVAAEQPNSFAPPTESLPDSTPDEVMLKSFEQINSSLAAELLERIRKSSAQFFEEVIVELLMAMGYGGADNPGKVLGRSGDNGVDGVIDQDPLGVDQIYIQGKKYQEGNNIGGADIRDIFGAINLKRAHKGIFLTTSDFTTSAQETARQLGSRIVLINGEQLARLMVRYNVGCRTEQILELKKIDEDYFM